MRTLDRTPHGVIVCRDIVERAVVREHVEVGYHKIDIRARPREVDLVERLARRVEVNPHPAVAARPLPHEFHEVAGLRDRPVEGRRSVCSRVGRSAVELVVAARRVDREHVDHAVRVGGESRAIRRRRNASDAKRGLRRVRGLVLYRPGVGRERQRVRDSRREALGDRGMSDPARMQQVVAEVAVRTRRERHFGEEVEHHVVRGEPVRRVVRREKRVERDDLRVVLALRPVAVEDRRADDLRRRTLPRDVEDEIRVGDIRLLRRIARTQVVRADEERERIDLARDVEIDVQVVANSPARSARLDPVAADAAVPDPVFRLRDVRRVLAAVLPDAEHLRPVAVRRETRRDGCAVLRDEA